MPPLTIVRGLFCGQGMTTLVEVHDDGIETNAAHYLALIDCGGSKADADRVTTAIANAVSASRNHRLDLVVISHQDGDHNRYLPMLGPKLTTINADVLKVYVGGLEWGTSQKAVKAFCAPFTTKVPSFTPERISHYDKPALGELDKHGTTVIRLLLSGLICTSTRSGFKKNGSSAVVVVEMGDNRVVLPGDATYETMDEIARILKPKNRISPAYGLSIPHHGSLSSAVKSALVKGRAPNLRSVDAFRAAIGAKRAFASAGPFNGENHPIEEVMAKFRSTDVTVAAHKYVSYVYLSTQAQKWKNNSSLNDLRSTVCEIAFPNDPAPPNSVKSVSRKGAAHGRYVFGNVVYRLAAPGVLRPEEEMTFERIGTIDAAGRRTIDPVYAAAP